MERPRTLRFTPDAPLLKFSLEGTDAGWIHSFPKSLD